MSSRMTSPSSSCSQESSKRVGQEGLGGNFYGVMCQRGSLPEVNQVTELHRRSGGWWGKKGMASWRFSLSFLLPADGRMEKGEGVEGEEEG